MQHIVGITWEQAFVVALFGIPVAVAALAIIGSAKMRWPFGWRREKHPPKERKV